MRTPRAPRLDERRTADFTAQLRERARAWIPSWGLADGERDFGRALLDIAARFSSEVAERLDDAGEKMRRGFLDWLAVRGKAARPARMPVVFKLADSARDAVLASAPVRMQADAGGTNVVFETETDVRLVPGRLEVVAGVDADNDAFYLPPPGLSNLEPLEPLPSQWQLKSFAAEGATTLQVDPGLGLEKGVLIQIAGQQYRIAAPPNGDLVTIEPPVPAGGFAPPALVTKVTAFFPFDGAHNEQNHVLYLGDADLLNIEAPATIDVIGGNHLGEGVTWEYWGKDTAAENTAAAADDEPRWRQLSPEDQQKTDALVLKKPKGAVAPRTIGTANARWIRARKARLDEDSAVSSTDSFALRINAPPDQASPGPNSDDEAPPDLTLLPPVEVIVNTTAETPRDFYPLGREPRLFDTFYLGCAEAFSKHGAEASVHFDLAEPSFAAIASIYAGSLGGIVAGVDKAGALHLLKVEADGKLSKLNKRNAMRPVAAGDVATSGARLTSQYFRPAMWSDAASGDLFVVVAAGPDAWLWREDGSNALQSGWKELHAPPTAPPLAPIEGLALIDNGGHTAIVALAAKRLWQRQWDSGDWQPVTVEDLSSTPLNILTISTVRSQVTGRAADTLLAIDDQGKLFGVSLTATYELLMAGPVAADVAPFGIVRANNVPEVVAVGAPNHDELLAWRSNGTDFMAGTAVSVQLDDSITGEQVGSDTPNGQPLIDARTEAGQLTVYALAASQIDGPVLLAWKPFDPNLAQLVFRTRSDSSVGIPRWSLTLLYPRAYFPAALAGEVLAAVLLGERRARTAPLATFKSALGMRNPPAAIAISDFVAYVDSIAERGSEEVEYLSVVGRDSFSNESFFWLKKHLPRASSGLDAVSWFGAVATLTGTVINSMKLQLDGNDGTTTTGTVLLIDDGSGGHTVAQVTATSGVVPNVNATLDIPLPNTTIANPPYRVPKQVIQARLVPSLELTNNNNDWQVEALDGGDLYFPALSPLRQRVIAVVQDTAAPHSPQRVAFADPWASPLPVVPAIDFIVDAEVTVWAQALGGESSNPTLAWEYWNGTGWWRLPINRDTTGFLKRSGDIVFLVPADLEPTDWAGKTNHWVRARLIGGDYGREKVVVTTTPTTGGGSAQTVDRSSEGIQAPYALDVWVRYASGEVVPAFLLTFDSGTLRDQSDANRTKAKVDVFTPLAVTLGRLSSNVVLPAAADDCPPDCDCPEARAGIATTSVPQSQTTGAVPQPATGRALFIGLNATLSEAPVNILLLVEEERDHSDLAPMKIEALIADRFVPIVVDDKTRALSESGLLSMAFNRKPTPRELFGRTLTWLRLTPGGNGDASNWKPAVRGAYLNAVWASAEETLTRELLGSSEGAPDLTFQLARPPVLHDTLELRVKEPLGDEERAELRKGDESRVLNPVDGLEGDWVRWDRVTDPGDALPAARVYALDEANGEIRFGDGQHGMIPPIGRDSIVAFSYKRTELGAPGSDVAPSNSIVARTALNLVSPVDSVEAVFAADQAAGGAPPESDERVLRFGTARLRHRGRAVTAHDFEDLALESSPDIVQARCFVYPGHVRLIVIMRGEKPQPNAAQVRELRSLLLESAPASLSVRGALKITGPRVRRLRVILDLLVASLDYAGEVSRTVQQRIKDLFDTATGGADNDGWPLGATPSDEDIALALVDTRRLEGIEGVSLREVMSDGSERPWPDAVKPDAVKPGELVALDDDAVRIAFKTVEVIA